MTGAAPSHRPDTDPSALLEAVFRHVAATRMAGMPIVNPALGVEAVGFACTDGVWRGVMVTPWSINLLLLPGGGDAFRPIGVGRTQAWTFPSGTYEFMGAFEDDIGPYQLCSLFSPVFDFPDHAAAVACARAVVEALSVAPGEAATEARDIREHHRLAGRSLQDAPLSRRAFLRGGL